MFNNTPGANGVRWCGSGLSDVMADAIGGVPSVAMRLALPPTRDGGTLQVPSEHAVRDFVDRAARRADTAHETSQAARARLAVMTIGAEEAAARAEMLIGPDSFRRPA